MLTKERHDIIRTLLAADGRVLANDLAQRFGVSEDTVRRDLRDLAKAGLCRRVHGGALLPAPASPPLQQRVVENASAKQRLAATAATLVSAGQTVLIDAGSTNLAIAAALPRNVPLTVVTNAPAIALALADHELAEVVVLGGRYDKRRGSTGGLTTVREIEGIYADLYFLGGCAIDLQFGVSALDAAEAEMKRAMVAQSRAVAVAATSDKLGTAAPFRVLQPADIIHLVVAVDADATIVAGLAAAGAAIHFSD